MLKLKQEQKLQQKLSPQQIQYIKLLQLPTLALEQRIKTELESNPLLEEGPEEEEETPLEETLDETPETAEAEATSETTETEEETAEEEASPRSKKKSTGKNCSTTSTTSTATRRAWTAPTKTKSGVSFPSRPVPR